MAAHLYNVASESIERQKTRKRDLHRDAPAQVRQVLKAAQDSAERGGARKDSAYLSRDDDGSYSISDNYERSSLILEYRNGQWTIRRMYSEAAPKRIDFEDALGNARLMFHG